jgi:L-serine dehydratase
MALSAFDLYSVGIGPSSSHTVGPMRAAKMFVDGLAGSGRLAAVARVQAELFGSLGATGHGHGSAKAVVLGLEGEDPATVDTDTSDARVAAVREDRTLLLAGEKPIPFDSDEDLVLHRRRSLPAHPNGMVFRALDGGGAVLTERTYYSVGGGFVVDENATGADRVVLDDTPLPFPFTTGAELLAHCAREGVRISDVMLANEQAWRTEAEIRAGMLHLWAVMRACVERGCSREGVLPGGLKVPRRAPALHRALTGDTGSTDPLRVMDWVNLFALAVNEENASGGRIVTAPTNGAAGIVPAVLHYYARFVPGADDDGVVRFLLTAAAIGILFKENASISGAEVGCQGEVGSACSMAAGALCEVLGGTPQQVENAAEVGIEHNLGLTCDPVGGLVQIPCIERNAMASVKAINAARLALSGDGSHKVSLDKAIKTMRETGRDMKVKYKETARGGLAVNVIEC